MKTLGAIFALILIVILLFFCGNMLLTNSNSFKINYDELQLMPDYNHSPDTFPEEKTNQMRLLHPSRYYTLGVALDGIYTRNAILEISKDIINSFDLGTAEYFWEMNRDDGTKLYLIFVDDKVCAIIDEVSGQTLFYSYLFDDNELNIQDASHIADTYNCTFFYFDGVLKDDTDDKKEQSHVTNKPHEPPAQNENSTSEATNELKEIVKEFVAEKLLNGAFLIIIAIAGSAVALFWLRYTLSMVYPRKLKGKLFPKTHNWLDNSAPNDIYIAVKISGEGFAKKISLLDYFSSVLGVKNATYVILGDAGEGKTFSLSKLAFEIISSKKNFRLRKGKKSKKLVPVLFNFSSFANCQKTDEIFEEIYNEIFKILGKHYNILRQLLNRFFRRAVKHFLNSGRFVIMFDGYDEIANPEKRLCFSKLLIDFIKEYKNCSYIITSRPYIYENEPFSIVKEGNVLSIVPLSKDQIRGFLAKLSYPKDKSAVDLYLNIVNSAQLEGVVTNPLLLTMIAHTYCASNLTITGSRVDLYAQCCRCLLETWEQKKVSFLRIIKRYNTIESFEIKQKLLQHIAYYLYKKNSPDIKEQELLELWATLKYEKTIYHGKVKNVLDEIILQSGILERTEKGHIRFRHRSFYEYYVACYLHDTDCNKKRLFEKINEEQNILFFYLCMQEKEDYAVDFLMNDQGHERLYQDILIERKINSEEAVETAVKSILRKIDYASESQMLALGYIAKTYQNIARLIRDTVTRKLIETDDDGMTIVNSLLCLISFCEKRSFPILFEKYINKINLDDFVNYSGEWINDFAKDIIILLEDYKQVKFIENLARTLHYEAIYSIFLDVKSCREIAAIGLLYLSSEQSVLKWLRIKGIDQVLTKKQITEAHRLQTQYGWQDESLSPDEITCLYQLLYLCKKGIENNTPIQKNMIGHRYAFVLCYMISREKGNIYQTIISNNGFKIKSIFEFSFHWGRLIRNKSKWKLNRLAVSSTQINWYIIFIELALLILHMYVYVIFCLRIFFTQTGGWNVNLTVLSNFSVIKFTSEYLIFSFALFWLNWVLHTLIKCFEYSMFSKICSIQVSVIISLLYMSFVNNLIFRLSTFVIMVIVSVLETAKHRYNYPTLKEPQFSNVVNYLNS